MTRPCLLLGLIVAAGCSPEPVPPNVVLVTLDTTRADFFGSYGHPRPLTPGFDRLASEGALFESAISSSAVTPVSHATILTGLYQHHHGLRVLSASSGFRLPEEIPTLATALQEGGWRTLAVHSAFPVSAHFGLERGFDVYESFDAQMQRPEGTSWERWNVIQYQRRSDQTTDLALEHLGDAEAPFFLWLHYWDPHDSQRLPPDEFLEVGPIAPETDPAARRRRYAEELRYVDQQFTRLVAFLEERGLYERTLFVITSDHGEGLGDHGWAAHRILYQEQIHVPLILRGPGVPAGTRVRELVRTADIAPTVLELAGLASHVPLDGRGLSALMAGEPDPPRLAYADQINGYDTNARMILTRPLDDFLYCVMDQDWKLVYRPSSPWASELYRLSRDPDETENLFDSEPAQRARLMRELAHHGSWVTAPFPEQAAGLDEQAEAQRAIEALGYLSGGPEGEPTSWEWTCVEHSELRLEHGGACPDCGEPLIPRARTD